jgi:hypothetical protein
MDSIEEAEEDPEFCDAPPCLQYLTRNGFPAGSRNAALFSMAVFAKLKYNSGWEDRVFEYNTRFMGPGTYSEVAGVIRSIGKKTYAYKCKENPLSSCCDKEECSRRLYGMKLTETDEKAKRPCILDNVTKVKLYAPAQDSKDEPYWVFEFGEDGSMDVTIDMKKQQSLFSREYDRVFYVTLLAIPDSRWNSEINRLCNPKMNELLEIANLAPDAGPDGQMMVHLEEFCTNKAKAKVKEELLIGKPWQDNDRTFFRSGDLMKYLDQQRFRAMKSDDIIKALKRRGAKHHNLNLKGKHVTCWSIPSFTAQTQSFDREVMKNEEEF